MSDLRSQLEERFAEVKRAAEMAVGASEPRRSFIGGQWDAYEVALNLLTEHEVQTAAVLPRCIACSEPLDQLPDGRVRPCIECLADKVTEPLSALETLLMWADEHTPPCDPDLLDAAQDEFAKCLDRIREAHAVIENRSALPVRDRAPDAVGAPPEPPDGQRFTAHIDPNERTWVALWDEQTTVPGFDRIGVGGLSFATSEAAATFAAQVNRPAPPEPVRPDPAARWSCFRSLCTSLEDRCNPLTCGPVPEAGPEDATGDGEA